MRARRHRPIVWPVFLTRGESRRPDRHNCNGTAPDRQGGGGVSSDAIPAGGAVCPTCGQTQGRVEFGPPEDEPG